MTMMIKNNKCIM